MSLVYLIKCEKYYKIGTANDVESRMAQLSTGNPFPLILIMCYEFANASIVESALHQKFSALKIRGEWFEIDYLDIEAIHSICELLGGREIENQVMVTEDEIEEADDAQLLTNKFDYEAMFADGWRMEPAGGGERAKYWGWRKGGGNSRLYIYGGLVSSLPYPSLEEMRLRFDK